MDSLPGYDAWLEKPYTDTKPEPEEGDCSCEDDVFDFWCIVHGDEDQQELARYEDAMLERAEARAEWERDYGDDY
jgi:hypothetical protein